MCDIPHFIKLVSTKNIEAHRHMNGNCIYNGQYRCITVIHGHLSTVFYILDGSLKKHTHISHTYSTTDHVHPDLHKLVTNCETVFIESNDDKQSSIDSFKEFMNMFIVKKSRWDWCWCC